MDDNTKGTIRLTHDIKPDLSLTIKHNTDNYTETTLDYQLNKHADIEVSKNSEGETNVSLNVKI